MEHRHVHGYWRRHWAAFFRWLHIYLSMVSFAILFFFAATGITLNHADWFENIPPRSTTETGTIPPEWVNVESVNQLQVVETLRANHGIRGALGDFIVDDDRCDVSFRGPGYSADAVIDRSTGQYELTELRMGLVAVVNDLHKGRDTGTAWSWVIDLSAALMIFVSLTGMVLICFLKRRRFTGLLFAAAGAVVCWMIYQFLVP